MPAFLSPLFLIGAVAAAIPVILHFLKRQPESRVKFAPVRLLKQGPVEHARQRRLRDLLLLALRVAVLLLLAVAFARPFVASAPALSSTATIVALDTSLSLSTPGRFERAKRLAKEAIGRVPARERIGVVTFADEAHVAAAVSGDRTLALSAIDAVRPDFGSTRYRAALGTAANLLEGRGGTVVVVTDLQENGWDAGGRVRLPESVRIEVVDVGEPPANVAITAVHVERDRLVATVKNLGPESRDVRISLVVRRGSERISGGEAIASIGANRSAEVPLRRPVGETAIVSVSDPGGIDGDNVRYVVLDESPRLSVLVVTASGDLLREAFYLQQALSAGGGERTAYGVEGVGAAQLATWDSTRLQKYAVVVLTSTRGLEARGRTVIRAYTNGGGGLLIAAAPEVDGEVVSDAIGGSNSIVIVNPGETGEKPGSRALAPVDGRHPVFRAFGADGASLALVNFRRIAALRGADCQTLARFTTGESALLDCGRGEGRALVLASDLNNRWNDFPLRATFVPFVHEAIGYLSGSRPSQSEYIVGEQPAGVSRTPGVTKVALSPNGPAKWVAVNVDPRESDPARMSAAEFQSATARLKNTTETEAGTMIAVSGEARQREERQHLWQYVLALVIVALAAESLVASRTV